MPGSQPHAAAASILEDETAEQECDFAPHSEDEAAEQELVGMAG